ncbi:MAG: flagellar export chaperone FliS [Acidobacteria bacterium]|nr:flagellar export chaperone FliS [Acidobacteriota bacterium]
MSYNPYENQMQQAILEAEPIELVAMLYSGLRESISKARDHFRRGEIRERAAAISRALEILAELASSLDRDRGGSLATQLAVLYDFAAMRLQEANARQEPGLLDEAERVIAPLEEAWRELRRSTENRAPTQFPMGEMSEPCTALSACG